MGFKRKDTLESPLRKEIEAKKMEVEKNKYKLGSQDYKLEKVRAGNQSFATKLQRKAA